MPDLLNGIASGSGPGPSNLSVMRAGRYVKTVATDVPGAEVSATNTIPTNLAAFLGGVHHSALTSVWATATENGTETPGWTTRNSERVAGLDTGRCGFYPCMSSEGPGLVTAWRNPSTGFTRVARWDRLTDAITFFDQPSGLQFDANIEITSGIVVGSLFFIGAQDGSSFRTHVFNIESGGFAQDTLFGGYACIPFATLNGNIYAGGRNGSNNPAIFIWLGSWVEVASIAEVAGAPTSGVTGLLFYERKGKMYLGTKKNAGNGLSLWEYDPTIPGVLAEVTAIVDPTLRAPSPTITTATLLMAFGFYVDVDVLAEPKYMIQVATDRKTNSPGCVLYEHTDTGIELKGNTDISLGINCLTLASYCVAGLTFKRGGLWGFKVAPAQPDPDGMLLRYRFGGDPGNSNTILRIAIASPLAAPDTRADTLIAPGAGLGQVGATLVEETPGVWRVDGWDADGVTDLTVIHQTTIDGVLQGVLTDWIFQASKT